MPPSMTPETANIIEVLNLLTLLYRSQKELNPKQSLESANTLRVTRANIDHNTKLSVSAFINTLHTLNRKGYLFYFSFYEEAPLQQVREALNNDLLSTILNSEKWNPLVDKIKIGVADFFDKNKPAKYSFDKEGMLADTINPVEMLSEYKNTIDFFDGDTVVKVILMPFKDINRLLEKLNDGASFNSIKDSEYWYDNTSYIFYVGKDGISTFHNNKPNKEHFALQSLFSNPEASNIDYDDIPEFDRAKDQDVEKKAFRDALNRFIDKHPELNKIFKIHKDYFEFLGER